MKLQLPKYGQTDADKEGSRIISNANTLVVTEIASRAQRVKCQITDCTREMLLGKRRIA